MQLKIVTHEAKPHSQIEVSPTIFEVKFNEPLVHQIVTAFLARARQGTHAQKTRSEVRGGGKKPWKQKGTGRARAGTITSPIWRKGGVTFAAKTQSYAQKTNKKMYKAAVRSIYSELIRQNRLIVTESFELESSKTKGLIEKLGNFGVDKVLIINDKVSDNLRLASRNIPNIDVCDAKAVNPVSLIKYPNILMTLPALREIERVLT